MLIFASGQTPEYMAEHNDLGKWGEAVVADYLAERGYAIVERNWRLGKIEIDIIASKGAEIVFVEVKTRREPSANPFEALTPRKEQMLLRGANAYMQTCNSALSPRIDVAAVEGNEHDYRIEYAEDAVRPRLRTYR